MYLLNNSEKNNIFIIYLPTMSVSLTKRLFELFISWPHIIILWPQDKHFYPMSPAAT